MTNSLNVSLQVLISSDGTIVEVKYDPVTRSSAHSGKLVEIEQSCPCCWNLITLNITVNPAPYDHIEEDTLNTIKAEVEVLEPLEMYIKIEEPPEPANLVKSQKKLSSKNIPGEYPCKTCGRIYKTRDVMYKHQKRCLVGDIVCPQCDDRPKFSNRPVYNLHVKSVHQGVFQCHQCNAKLEDSNQWVKHMISHEKRTPDGYKCSECNKKFTYNGDYRGHMEDHYKGKMMCRLCSEPFEFRSEFVKHLTDVHNYSQFPCPHCTGEYEDESLLYIHLIDDHDFERISCALCKKSFASVEEKNSHCTSKCRSNEAFTCKICRKAFNTAGSLKSHGMVCLAEDIVCHQCTDKPAFSSRPAFYEHSRDFHDGKFLCHLCDPPGLYDNNHKWIVHMNVHKRNREKQLECRYCMRSFLYTTEHQAHEDDHYKGEITCKLCEDKQIFTLRSDFKDHMTAVHVSTLFYCPICESREFEVEHKLNNHMVNAHWMNKKLFLCKICRHRFKTQEIRDAHSVNCVEQADQNLPEEYPCEICGKVYQKKRVLYKHRRRCRAEEITCYQCDDRQKFSQQTHFYTHVQDIHSGTYVCHVCQVNLNDNRAWHNHMTAHKKSGSEYECKYCQKKFLYSRQHLLHEDDHYRGEMSCKFCKEIFELRSEFIEHFKTVHASQKFQCPFCDIAKEYDTELKLNTHCIHVHWTEKRYLCYFCREKFATVDEKEKHVAVCTLRNESQFNCNLCNEKFALQHFLDRHIKSVHETHLTTYVCHVCGKTMTRKKHYDEHVAQHMVGKYECHHCGRKLQTKESIESHILLFHYPKELCRFACDLCELSFATADLLIRHKRSHVQKVPAKCSVCQKELKDKSALLRHMKRMHSEESTLKNFACTKCNFVTSEKKYLKGHMQQHLSDKDKPYQCRFCQKGFINRQIVRRHELLHTNERPHACEICGKMFRNRSDLVSHNRVHTGVKPYQCSVCQKRFSDRGCHRSHMLKHEKEMNVTLDKSVRKKKVIVTAAGSSVT